MASDAARQNVGGGRCGGSVPLRVAASPCRGRGRGAMAHGAGVNRVAPARGRPHWGGRPQTLCSAPRSVAVDEADSAASAASDGGGPNGGTFDLLVVGAGPSGLATAERVASRGKRVCVVDPAPESVWPNNYGVWIDEFEALGLEDCIDKTWNRATVFLDGDPDSERTLARPYGRVDRRRLKRRLLDACASHGVVFKATKADALRNFSPSAAGASSSPVPPAMGREVTLASGGYSDVICSDGETVRGKLVLDATGYARKFTQFPSAYDPGYQGAYGIMAEVESHPFAEDAMLFMDWRDDHLSAPDAAAVKARNDARPTFLYAMPFGPTKIFFEETSLVARPAVPFDDLKERLELRLKHLGVKVKAVTEEEFCLIPMGSQLPTIPQRVLGIGGTAGMVHPSTGYMVARMLAAAPTLADAICDELNGGQPTLDAAPHPEWNQAGAQGAGGAPRGGAPDRAGAVESGDAPTPMSRAVWEAAWPVERLQQREFFNFGMEILLTLDLRETRAFFKAFFGLSDYHWQGFLSSRLSLAELVVFGLALFRRASPEMRLSLIGKGIPGLVGMLTNVVKANTMHRRG